MLFNLFSKGNSKECRSSSAWKLFSKISGWSISCGELFSSRWRVCSRVWRRFLQPQNRTVASRTQKMSCLILLSCFHWRLPTSFEGKININVRQVLIISSVAFFSCVHRKKVKHVQNQCLGSNTIALSRSHCLSCHRYASCPGPWDKFWSIQVVMQELRRWCPLGVLPSQPQVSTPLSQTYPRSLLI